jgi:two-component system, cell cycle sensor histidine kinase and response regulator CckA
VERIPEKTLSETTAEGHHTILIVEDEHLMLRLLEKFFSDHGYHVLVAADGEQAIEIYRRYKRRIEAVLLDVRVPKITGGEVFCRMKEENDAVKVVIASGFLEANMKDQVAFAGVKRFVSKPYILDEVLETVRSLIEDP